MSEFLAWVRCGRSAIITALALCSCGTEDPPPLLLEDEAFDAVGSIGTIDGQGRFQPFCSGTLIGPKLVVTAKHCAEGPAGQKLVNMASIYFGVGSNTRLPTALYEAIDSDSSEVSEGGFLGVGNDVAVLHLATRVNRVVPVVVAPELLEPSRLGERFASVGFELQGLALTHGAPMPSAATGLRRTVASTLRALSGKPLQLIFPTRDAWLEHARSVMAGAPPDIPEELLEELALRYLTAEVLEGYEAYAGNAYGGAQVCYGDAGGPLLRFMFVTDDRVELRAYGVVSGGIPGADAPCAFGAFYATFGPRTLALFERARAYVDPCAGMTVAGECQVNRAVRCTGKGEGERRIIATDCAALDLTCGRDSGGAVACVDPSGPPPASSRHEGLAPAQLRELAWGTWRLR